MAESEQLVLVTGGSGYIASTVIKLLQEDGHKVRTTIRNSKNETRVKHLKELCPEAKPEVEVVDADLMQADSWPSAVEGCTYVLHIASPFPLNDPKHEDEVIKPAVEGTLNVLKACAAAKTVKRVVLTSSNAAIRGGLEPPREEPYSEKDWLDMEDRRNPVYTRSKALAEKAAWNFVEELPDGEKFELAVVNPTLVLGPVYTGTPGASVEVLSKLLKKEYPIIPQLCFPICDVRDVALAHVKCMTAPEAAGNRHLIMSKDVYLKEMADILHKEFTPQGYKIPTKVMPNALLSFVCLFNKQMKIARAFGQPTKSDLRRMTEVLDLTPVPVENTILEMAYSMIEKGMVPKTAKYKGPSSSAD